MLAYQAGPQTPGVDARAKSALTRQGTHSQGPPHKHRDVATLDIQHTEYRSAFGNHVFLL